MKVVCHCVCHAFGKTCLSVVPCCHPCPYCKSRFFRDIYLYHLDDCAPAPMLRAEPIIEPKNNDPKPTS